MKSEKTTSGPGWLESRWYDDACGTAFALELIGERWSMLIVRELTFGPRRFSELKRDLSGISANVLSERLAGLEARGVVTRRRLPSPASAQVYELTEWGMEAEPLVRGLGRWAMRHPEYDASPPLSAVSMMMSLRTTFRPERATRDLRLGVRTDDREFVVEVRDASLTVTQRHFESADVDAVVSGAPRVLAALLYGKKPLGTLEADAGLSVEGDRRVVQRFVRQCDLPEKVKPPRP